MPSASALRLLDFSPSAILTGTTIGITLVAAYNGLGDTIAELFSRSLRYRAARWGRAAG